MTGAPDWLDEVPVRPGPPWLSMGVRPLDDARWLVVDERREAELAFKARLLAERPDEVFAALPGTEAAGREVAELVVAWLDRHGHPVASVERADPTDPAPGRVPRHPLDTAGRLVQEDLCLMVDHGAGVHHLDAASLCFPSHWRLADKLGRPAREIHDPVPHYRDELADRVDTFLARLRPDRPVWRRNLSVHDHEDLFRPEPHESPDSFPPGPDGADRVWLRSEYQTLVRLPRSGAILFTIKTQTCPLRVLADRPAVAAGLALRFGAHAASGTPAPFPAWLPDWLAASGAPGR